MKKKIYNRVKRTKKHTKNNLNKYSRKYLKRMKKITGGLPNMIYIDEKESGIDEQYIKGKILNIITEKDINYIYFAVGTAVHEEQIDSKGKQDSTSKYQTIPYFISEENPDRKVLVILYDNFNSKISKKYLYECIKIKKDWNFLVINRNKTYETELYQVREENIINNIIKKIKSNLDKIFIVLFEVIQERNIHDWLACNYVDFIYHTYGSREEYIYKGIDDVFNTRNEEDHFFKWTYNDINIIRNIKNEQNKKIIIPPS